MHVVNLYDLIVARRGLKHSPSACRHSTTRTVLAVRKHYPLTPGVTHHLAAGSFWAWAPVQWVAASVRAVRLCG